MFNVIVRNSKGEAVSTTHIADEVSGIESNTVQLGEIYRFQQDGFDADGKVRGRFTATGYIPVFLEKLQERGTKIDFSLFE